MYAQCQTAANMIQTAPSVCGGAVLPPCPRGIIPCMPLHYAHHTCSLVCRLRHAWAEQDSHCHCVTVTVSLSLSSQLTVPGAAQCCPYTGCVCVWMPLADFPLVKSSGHVYICTYVRMSVVMINLHCAMRLVHAG